MGLLIIMEKRAYFFQEGKKDPSFSRKDLEMESS